MVLDGPNRGGKRRPVRPVKCRRPRVRDLVLVRRGVHVAEQLWNEIEVLESRLDDNVSAREIVIEFLQVAAGFATGAIIDKSVILFGDRENDGCLCYVKHGSVTIYYTATGTDVFLRSMCVDQRLNVGWVAVA